MDSKLTSKEFSVENPVEIDYAVETLRQLLIGNLVYLDYAYHIAQRFYARVGEKKFFLPMTYVSDATAGNPKDRYLEMTPNNGIKGFCFFVVSPGDMSEALTGQGARMRYNVGIIFSLNLALINAEKLGKYLFTQELLAAARILLVNNIGMDDKFDYTLRSETRDLREVFREFVLDDVEQYNQAPLQCFRIDLSLTVETLCQLK